MSECDTSMDGSIDRSTEDFRGLGWARARARARACWELLLARSKSFLTLLHPLWCGFSAHGYPDHSKGFGVLLSSVQYVLHGQCPDWLNTMMLQ